MALEAMQRNGHNLGLGVFECEGLYDTPKLAPVHFDEKTDWISFNCARTDRRRDVHGVHFFVDDYIFERTWHDPRRYALLLSEFKAAMTPDFSPVYRLSQSRADLQSLPQASDRCLLAEYGHYGHSVHLLERS